MSAALSPARRAGNGWLGLTGLLLLGIGAWPWVQPVSVSTAAAPTGDAGAPPPALPPLPAPATLSAIAERPLFSPSRRPPAAEKAAPADPGIESRYRLLGSITADTGRQAVLAEGARHFQIGEGGSLEGWTVSRIEHDRVTLSSPKGTAILQLQRPGDAVPTDPAAAAAAAAALGVKLPSR